MITFDLKKFLGGICVIVALGAAAWLWLGYFTTVSGWLGGSLIAKLFVIVFVPGVPFFPFVYWFVEGAFPGLYFLLMAVGVVSGMFAASFFTDS